MKAYQSSFFQDLFGTELLGFARGKQFKLIEDFQNTLVPIQGEFMYCWIGPFPPSSYFHFHFNFNFFVSTFLFVFCSSSFHLYLVPRLRNLSPPFCVAAFGVSLAAEDCVELVIDTRGLSEADGIPQEGGGAPSERGGGAPSERGGGA